MSYTSTRRLRRVLFAICAVAMLPAPVARAGVEPQPFRTGLFGIAAGQSIRISVLNTSAAAAPIVGHVTLLDLDGRALLERRTRALTHGQGTFVDVNAGPDTVSGAALPGLAAPRAARHQVRAEVSIESDGDVAIQDLMANIHLTLEVFDIATGSTIFTLPFTWIAFNPQPEPPDPGIVR